MACTLSQADHMIEACREAGVHLSVNMVARYETSTIKAKELVAQGAIGQIIGLQFHVMADKPESYWTGGYSGRVKTEWRKYWQLSGGGILVMNLVHEIDRLRYITGLEMVQVLGQYDTFCTEVEVEDYIAAIYRYDNGAIGTVTATSCAPGKGSCGSRIIGTEGQIVLGGGEVPISTSRATGLNVFTRKQIRGLPRERWTELPVAEGRSPRQVYTEQFAEAVFTGQWPEISGEEGRKTLEVILATYQAGADRHTAIV